MKRWTQRNRNLRGPSRTHVIRTFQVGKNHSRERNLFMVTMSRLASLSHQYLPQMWAQIQCSLSHIDADASSVSFQRFKISKSGRTYTTNMFNLLLTTGYKKRLKNRAPTRRYRTNRRDRSSVTHTDGKICGLLNPLQFVFAATMAVIIYAILSEVLSPQPGMTTPRSLHQFSRSTWY